MAQRVCFVSGSTRGIGNSIARHLLILGHRVIVNYHEDDAAMEDTQKEFSTISSDFEICKADVSKFPDISRAIDDVSRTTGPVDILVNNAGINMDTFFHKMSYQQWEEVMMTNLFGIFNCSRSVIEGMREREFGRIINIASVVGNTGNMGQVNYSASKSGIIGFTKSLALESIGKGITVNAISPGYVATDMTQRIPEKVKTKILDKIPMHRFAQPDEISDLVEYLISDKAAYITGQIIHINGGLF